MFYLCTDKIESFKAKKLACAPIHIGHIEGRTFELAGTADCGNRGSFKFELDSLDYKEGFGPIIVFPCAIKGSKIHVNIHPQGHPLKRDKADFKIFVGRWSEKQGKYMEMAHERITIRTDYINNVGKITMR